MKPDFKTLWINNEITRIAKRLQSSEKAYSGIKNPQSNYAKAIKTLIKMRKEFIQIAEKCRDNH